MGAVYKEHDMRNLERFERLRQLTPIEAARAWLEGDFGLGDEPALIEALRKDKGITATDDKIIDIFLDAMEENVSAEEVLERLKRAV